MGWRAEGRALARGRPSSGPVQEQAGALERRREERATERWAGAPEGRERGGKGLGWPKPVLGWFRGWAKKGRKEYFSNKNPFLFLNSIS